MPETELDPSLLARLVRIGGRDLLLQLIDSFIGEAPARRTALAAAVATHDLPALGAVAHTIVAGAGQLGATRLSNDARALEEAARSGNAAEAEAGVPGLLDRYARALAALAEARQSA
jgi:HPt (histidine-containing phosphotransfer) domain-containing protein